MSNFRKRHDSNNTKYVEGKLHIECKDCKEYKLADEKNFIVRKDTTFGFRSTCKRCFSIRRAKVRNSEVGKKANKNTRLKTTFGISLDDFNDMRKQQNYTCPICNRKEDEFYSKTNKGKIKGFVVDHNHDTGKVRGLLCSECNVGLGFLQDSINIVKNAVTYLEERGSYGS